VTATATPLDVGQADTATVEVPPRFDMARRLLRTRRLQFGLAMLAPIALLALFEPLLPFGDSNASNLQARFLSPSLDHLFGTDALGRDVLARTVAGGRISLVVGVAAAFASVSIGIVLGTVAAYFGKWVDSTISGLVNVLLAFPGLLIGLTAVAMFGAGVGQVILAVSIAFTPRAIRLQRSLVLGIKSNPYMDAARMVAAPTRWILVRHIVPNTLSPMLVVASIYTANAILIEATMSFMGLGIVPPTPSWGNIIKDGEPYLRESWWISLMPALLLILVAIALHLIADGARQVLDPTEHDRGAK